MWYLVAGAVLMMVTTLRSDSDIVKNAPRGIRNNNPTNIVENPNNNWQGAIGSDGRFVIFDTPEFGIRAAAKILLNYERRGLDTVEEIISTWAPPHENNTQAYIDSVAKKIKVDAYERIDVAQHLPALLDAIIYHENGEQPYPQAVIQRGIEYV